MEKSKAGKEDEERRGEVRPEKGWGNFKGSNSQF